MGTAGLCSVCSAPCSSCLHAQKILLKSNNESAGESCFGNTVTGQLSILSFVGEMESTSDSFSENAAGKDSSRAFNASAPSDSMMHSKQDGWRSPEGHDDCLSCVNGTDEQVNRKYDAEDCGIKYNRKIKIGREISRKVSPSSSQTDISITKSVDDATDMQKVQNTSQSSDDKNLICEETPMDVNDDKPSDAKVELLKPSVDHINSSSLNGVASDNVSSDPPKTVQDSVEKDDEMVVETRPVNESDDSDMVEQDVKVCDICGDAGREDLLAICSRCSDGAEHTYCMREMLEKPPKGEWLCEECKKLELVENRKQEKIGNMDENEKKYSSGQAIEDVNNSDDEGGRTKSYTKIPSKRLRDDEDVEVSSVAKKPALELTVGSLKTSNSSVAVLSRESSLKHLENDRQSRNRSTLDTVSVTDTKELAKPASDARGLNLRGTFGKCNSLSSLNSKPKVKLVDQVIIQRQKSVKEHGRLKEGAVRSTEKSMSFRSTESNCSESKLKMISPRSSPIQDGKITKERSVFDHQGSFRTEHPSNNSEIGASMKSTSILDNIPSSSVESSSIAMPSIHHEVKQVQTDSKSAALLRSSGFADRRTADLPSSTGGFKRPSKHVPNTSVLSSTNGVSNTEQKYNQTSLKQDPASCPGAFEKLPVNTSEGLSDGLVQSKDITDAADRPREYSGSRFGSPSMRPSIDESDHLKAAIQAAVLRKPGIYRKHRSVGQSDESFVQTVAPVASHIDRLSSVRNRKLSSDAELSEKPEISRDSTANPPKEETHNSVKQLSLVPTEGFSSVGCKGVYVDLSLRDTFSNVPAAIPLVPEHEYIWQGSFEICQSGQTFELWDGIQAHLPTCASPKVVEAVNKLKSRIILDEVSRASTWPVQFQEDGVGEDNIALFFFAKDLQSHDKIYKVLLENMMKNDLALKGNINGVDLLIFPSNRLPVNFQRWNMLFFLWGVFRGKKESNQRQMPESVLTPRNIPPAIMSLSENRCSLRPITEDASQDLQVGLGVPASEELPDSPRVVKRNFDIHVSPKDQLVHGLSSISLSAVRSDGPKQCGDVRSAYQEAGISSSCIPPVAMSKPVIGSEQRLMQPDLGERAISEENSHQTQLKIRNNAIDLSSEGEIPSEDEMSTRDLNTKPNRWLANQKEPTIQQPSSSGHCSPRNNVMQNGACTILEKANHVAYQHDEASVGTVPKQYADTERYLFAVESQADDRWKTHVLDDNESIDRAPKLELGLGGERSLMTLENHVVEEEARKKTEDDVSASLSLSL